jgi:hypothetical protein
MWYNEIKIATYSKIFSYKSKINIEKVILNCGSPINLQV